MKIRSSCLAAAIVAMTLAASLPARAATAAPGPYYATPSWDQKLTPDIRFVVLSNWNNEAVLDRETGLVWKLALDSEATNLDSASLLCATRSAGRRAGWRLPTLQEVMRTMFWGDIGLAQGTPFDALLAGRQVWTSTTHVGTQQFAVYFSEQDYPNVRIVSSGIGSLGAAWCVQSPAPGPAAQ